MEIMSASEGKSLFNSRLTEQDKERLEQQNARLVTEFQACSLEKNAQKHWDLFYKRNETRFFKDRHWTTREFAELLDNKDSLNENRRVLFEVGCGVGNFIFPLLEEKLNFFIYACDLSRRAVEILRKNPLYNEENVHAFQTDITTEDVFREIPKGKVDIAALIFVLSAIHPDKFVHTLGIIKDLLKPGGILLFRDYGLYDMAQIRFKAGHKIDENFYMRQDGTRSYFFSTEYAKNMFAKAGFDIISNDYINRRTVNKKEDVDVPRTFIQVKAQKPR